MSFLLDPVASAVILVIGLVVLGISTRYTIKSVTGIAQTTGVSETAIGFLLLAFVTSIPELTVTIFSAFEGAVDLALGNILGSNVANIGLVLGFPFMIVHLIKRRTKSFSSISGKEFQGMFFGLFIASIIPIILWLWSFSIQVLGGSLIITYLLISYMILRSGRRREVESSTNSQNNYSNLVRNFLVTILALIGVIGSSYFIVESGVALANLTGISGGIMGALVVAVGTSLPELAISISAVSSRHGGLALGNAVGSCLTNVTLILGVLLLLSPINIILQDFVIQFIFTLVFNIFLAFFILIKRLKVMEGATLAAIYMIFIFLSLSLTSFT